MPQGRRQALPSPPRPTKSGQFDDQFRPEGQLAEVTFVRQDANKDLPMNIIRGSLATSAPRAVVLVRVLVGGVFLSEGIQKFIYPDALGAGQLSMDRWLQKDELRQ